MYFITTKRMLEVCFSAHPNIQYRTFLSCMLDDYLIEAKEMVDNSRLDNCEEKIFV